MCNHGTYRTLRVINQQNNQDVYIDACIAEEIANLNTQGIVTLGCCCGHGMAGQIAEWENASGKWKAHYEPPNVLIDVKSAEQALKLGYRPYPYYYADGEYHGVWQMYLKTGCLTMDDVERWHKENEK